MTATMASRISIIGAGVAGLILGQCLRRRQIPAIIWEKSNQLPPLQNFGITLHPQVYRSLFKSLGLDEQTFYDELAIRHGGKHAAGDSIRVNRSAWLRSLQKDLDIRWDHKLKDIDTTDGSHKLIFTNEADKESSHTTDLVIVTDGVHSASRNSQSLSSDAFDLEVLPFVVFNGKRRFQADALPEGLAACLDNPHGLSHRVGEVLLQITVGYNDSGKNEVGINYTLSRPATSADDSLLGRSKADAETLAKQFIDEASNLTHLEEPFRTVFEPARMKNDRLLHWLMRSAVIGHDEARRLAASGIVLVGDAAHPQPILGGDGANAAVLDAIDLAEAVGVEGKLDSQGYATLMQRWKPWSVDAKQNLSNMHKTGTRASM